jgi:hypothetical protein
MHTDVCACVYIERDLVTYVCVRTKKRTLIHRPHAYRCVCACVRVEKERERKRERFGYIRLTISQHSFNNMVLKRIIETKSNEVTGEWRRLHDEELYSLSSSPNIIRVINSRGLRWAGHVARMGRGDVHIGF